MRLLPLLLLLSCAPKDANGLPLPATVFEEQLRDLDGFPSLTVYRDPARKVTCWRYGSDISCLRDEPPREFTEIVCPSKQLSCISGDGPNVTCRCAKESK